MVLCKLARSCKIFSRVHSSIQAKFENVIVASRGRVNKIHD